MAGLYLTAFLKKVKNNMPYKAVGKCVYRKDTGKKVGCTKGSVKKYLAALHINTGHEESKKITQKDVMASIRKPMPQPTTPHKDKKEYNRKKFKSFKDYWDENADGLDGSQKVTDDTTATAESTAGTLGYGSSDTYADHTTKDVDDPLKYEDENSPGDNPTVNAATAQGIEGENFINGKHPERKGLAKRSGVNTKASVSSLRRTAKHSSGEKARMAHWLANMKAGKARARRK